MTDHQAKAFIAAVRQQGKTVGLYHSASGFKDLGQDFDWIALWRNPQQPPNRSWDFWQFQGSPLDRDHFNGTEAQLRAFAGLKQAIGKPYHLALPGGSFWVYRVANGVITGRRSVEFTKGTSAPCSAPSKFDWPGHNSRLLVEVTAGGLAGEFVSIPQANVQLEVLKP